jgi:hypothetical protein
LIHGGYGERKIFIPQNEKITTNRREPGGRRENEIFIKPFVFLAVRKKNLCGLCVLGGSILSFIPGGYGDFYNFLCNKKRQLPIAGYGLKDYSAFRKKIGPKEKSGTF